jgi:small-conductance mechanosensitive channel
VTSPVGEPSPDPAPAPDSPQDAAETVYEGALPRIQRCMLVLAVLAPLGAWYQFGWRTALGLACGCLVAYLNFQWLKRGVEALATRIVEARKSQSSKGIILRFLLRYVLMGLAAYGILSVSPASLYGLLAGLFLPVAAIACEAAYETYVALARGL